MAPRKGGSGASRLFFSLLIVSILISSGLFLMNRGSSVNGIVVSGGHLTGDIVWNSTDSPVEVQDNLTIPEGSSLTINRGCEVVVKEGCWISIQGELDILGTDQEPVTIRSSGPNGFDRINISSGSRAYIDHGNITDAERGIHATDIDTVVYLHNSSISSSDTGLSATSSSLVWSINNSITADHPFQVSGAVVHQGYWFFFTARRDTDGSGVYSVQVRVDHKKGSQSEYEEWTAFDSVSSGIETDAQGKLPPIAV
ncbi:MAG: hypothetical protein R6V01_10040, partial [Thermoplasmatota archaeon]